MKQTKVLPISIAAAVLAVSVSCNRTPEAPAAPGIKADMSEVYQSTRNLYSRLWDRDKFLSTSATQLIQTDLDKLSAGFHRAEKDFPIEQFEPGLRVVLQVQQDLLKDAAERFRQGKKDYVMWRLRGMTANCVACHSRVGVPLDFAGEDPGSGRGSAEEVLGRGEFLVATRQFERAREYLLSIARGSDGMNYESVTRYEALQLYLVAAVRVKNDYEKAAADIDEVTESTSLGAKYRRIAGTWIKQLKGLVGSDEAPLKPAAAAEKLLQPVIGSESDDIDEENLVQTLQASKLLHAALINPLVQAEHRRCQYLLAVAYLHLPLRQFEVFQDRLLEQVIRENPGSAEARQAFELYQSRSETLASGSSGVNFDAEDVTMLNELRRIAYGAPQLVLPDTGLDLNQ